MAKEFDVAIMGAGIGGLTAANVLRDSGKLLVVDKLFRPGGTSYSFKRNGYEFLTGPLGFSHPHFVNSSLKEMGIDQLNFNKKDYQFLAGDINITISGPLEHLEKELSKLYPHENVHSAVAELKNIIEKVRGVFVHKDNVFNAIENEQVKEDLSPYFVPASDYFSDFVEDEDLLNFLSGIGLTKSSDSTIAAAYMWDVLTEIGIWYPEGGFKSLIRNLYEPVKASISLRTGVEEISIHGDYYQLTTSKGVYAAKNVISNADANITAQLLSEGLQEDFKEFLDRRKEGGSVFTSYLGVDKSKIDTNRIRASHVLYYPYLDQSNHLKTNRFYESEVEVSFISNYDNLAPEGRMAIMLRAPFAYDNCKFETKEKYYQFKEKTSIELLEIIEPLIPNIVSNASVIDASTPLTYEVWGGRYRGSVPGWDWTDKIATSMVKTPLDNFYLCGIYSFSIPFLGAFPTSLYSGKMAANYIIGKDSPS
ncbi:MAG: phytoene desaturase family protein [Archaeoglobaceae archaeon]